MSGWRIWLNEFLRPCPFGRKTVIGATLGAGLTAFLLLLIHVILYGYLQTAALFPKPIHRLAVFLHDMRAPGLSVATPNYAAETLAQFLRSHPGYLMDSVKTWRAGTETFARAPLRNDNLPYSEIISAPLNEAVKQVDYAIFQTLLRLDLDLRTLHVLSLSRVKSAKGEEYPRQNLRIYLPQSISTAKNYAVPTQFAQTIALWCERAKISEHADKLQVFLDDNLSHEIYFSFLPGELPPDVNENTPCLSIVIDDMGENVEAARQLLALDLPLSFSIWPYSAHATKIAQMAFAKGQEILLHQPCEPKGFPKEQPGPGAVFVRMDEAEIKKIVMENVQRVPHAVGINNHMGSRFTEDARASTALSLAAAEAGFFVLDSITSAKSILGKTSAALGITTYRRAVFLDDTLSLTDINRALQRAEQLALKSGQAIAIGHPHPQTIEAIKNWSMRRNLKIRLIPLRMQRPYIEN